jgi:hypothetical protein
MSTSRVVALRDSLQLVFDGVFDRHDVEARAIQASQRRVKRRGFSGSGRTGDEHDTVGLVDQAVDAGQRRRIHAEAFQIQPAALLVEEPQYRALSEAGRQGGDAHVDLPAGDPQGNAAVLRQALLGDVELRHDLDAGEHRCVERSVRLGDTPQMPVDPEAHHGVIFVRLDMNVGGALAQRLREQHVDHADDGRIVFRIEQILRLRQFLHQPGEVHGLLEVACDKSGRLIGTRIRFREPALEFLAGLDSGHA